jgi:ERF superfamily
MTKDSVADTKPLSVYQAIAKVQAELAKDGISKDRKNKEQGYSFRGIDDLYNALAIQLSNAGLCILPRVLSRELKERMSKSNTPLFNVVVEAEFDFVSAADGSKHTVKTFGEAMDSADKATNKAMSAAYKYACLQAFCIPTEGDNDADGTTPEVVAPDRASQVKGVFETPVLRDQFVSNCVDAIKKAPTVEDLRNQKVLNLAKWNAMKESAPDLDAYNTIIHTYNARLTEFKEAAAKVNPAPQTVEAAKKAPATLLNDEIPF